VSGERFQDFFENPRYLALKNHLYNYRLRKRAVEEALRDGDCPLVLEVGSGISPVVTFTDRVVYSELSASALEVLRGELGRGFFVSCDASHLPFRDGSFSQAVASEVLEHLPDDRPAVLELRRVVREGGQLIVTFPHRRRFFAADDVFVGHARRYELDEMKGLLAACGFKTVEVKKVLGPMDKILMLLAVWVFQMIPKGARAAERETRPVPAVLLWLFCAANRILEALCWVDARLFPRSFSTILLIKAKKVR